MGSNYWYCSIAEHISFICPKWLESYCEKNSASIEEQKLFCHKKGAEKTSAQFVDFLKNFLYKVTPNTFAMLRKMGMGGDFARSNHELLRYPPNWTSAKDHFVTIIRKEN
jgi:hypothetical protein